MREFSRLKRLPAYVFAQVTDLKTKERAKKEDIIDFGMGNPDLATPKHIVDKLIDSVNKKQNHRYSASRGIPNLRLAISNWYKRRFDVDIDPDKEAIVTLGVKEGISNLMHVTIGLGDVVLAPTPTYPIHSYAAIIAGGNVRSVPLGPDEDFFQNLINATRQTSPKPKILIISYPHNPTTEVVDINFFKKIVAYAKEYDVMIVHDFAYADIVFDGYKPPSFLEVEGAKDVGVEFFSMSKSYNMAGWRVGFCVGNPEMIYALQRIKSYSDYGAFQPIQIASIIALNEDQSCVKDICETYRKRRDTLVNGLNKIGWELAKPKGTMFVWAKIPDQYLKKGSIEFSKMLIQKAKVAVSPGLGFGEYGDDYVRFALIENQHRIRQAVKGIKNVL